MNRFILAAAALAIATPVLADPSQTALIVRQHFAADEGGNDAVIFFDDNGITEKAAWIHSMTAANQDMVNRAQVPTARDLLTPNRGVVNETAARIFQQIESEDPRS